MPSHPASAAGPDLRELVLGSEGRLGILTEATLRTAPIADRDRARSWFVPTWERGLEVARQLGQAGLPLSMIRLSTPLETTVLLALGGRPRVEAALRGYLRLRGAGASRCMLILGAAGRRRIVDAGLREAGSIAKRAGAVGSGEGLARRWLAGRFRSAALRDALWDRGYALDTLETAADWTRLPGLAVAVARALRDGLARDGERVLAFSHLSHVYPSGSSLYTTFVFRLAPDPDQTLERWTSLKRSASDAIVRHGGTISHQHGVGRDHRPWLEAEKGTLGLAMLEAVRRTLDPDHLMNPGVLLDGQAGGGEPSGGR